MDMLMLTRKSEVHSFLRLRKIDTTKQLKYYKKLNWLTTQSSVIVISIMVADHSSPVDSFIKVNIEELKL